MAAPGTTGNYDEDLSENPFFELLQTKHRRLFQQAAEMRWVVCIPRTGSMPSAPITRVVVESHVLRPATAATPTRRASFVATSHKSTPPPAAESVQASAASLPARPHSAHSTLPPPPGEDDASTGNGLHVANPALLSPAAPGARARLPATATVPGDAGVVGTQFESVSGKQASIRGGHVITGTGYSIRRAVRILFEETFYNDREESFMVLCLEAPLESYALQRGLSLTTVPSRRPDRMAQQDDGGRPVAAAGAATDAMQPLCTYQDCTAYLFGDGDNAAAFLRVSTMVSRFCNALSMAHRPLEQVCEAANSLFLHCVQVMLDMTPLGQRARDSAKHMQRLRLAMETYVTDAVYSRVFPVILDARVHYDIRLNRLTRMLFDQRPESFGVPRVYVPRFPRALAEVAQLNHCSTPLEKLLCLKCTIDHLANPEADRSARAGDVGVCASAPLSTDDLLPLVICLVVQSDIPNWFANIYYIERFCFSHMGASELHFDLTTFHAAVEYIVTSNEGSVPAQHELPASADPPAAPRPTMATVLPPPPLLAPDPSAAAATAAAAAVGSMVPSDASSQQGPSSPRRMDTMPVVRRFSMPGSTESLGGANFSAVAVAPPPAGPVKSPVAAVVSATPDLLQVFFARVASGNVAGVTNLLDDNHGGQPDSAAVAAAAPAPASAPSAVADEADTSDNGARPAPQPDRNSATSPVPPHAAEQPLCHPLCTCEKCARVTERRKAATASTPRPPVTVDARDIDGFTALHLAAQYGHAAMAAMLLRRGATVDPVNNYGATPLHIAARRGHPAIMQLLLEHGTDVNMGDAEGNTALHLCVAHGSVEATRLLLHFRRNGVTANVNATNRHGDTPLHVASRWGAVSILNLLLRTEADTTIHNHRNETVLQCAQSAAVARAIMDAVSAIHSTRVADIPAGLGTVQEDRPSESEPAALSASPVTEEQARELAAAQSDVIVGPLMIPFDASPRTARPAPRTNASAARPNDVPPAAAIRASPTGPVEAAARPASRNGANGAADATAATAASGQTDVAMAAGSQPDAARAAAPSGETSRGADARDASSDSGSQTGRSAGVPSIGGGDLGSAVFAGREAKQAAEAEDEDIRELDQLAFETLKECASNPARVRAIESLLLAVAEGDINMVRFKLNVDDVALGALDTQLCHPLCDCEKCMRLHQKIRMAGDALGRNQKGLTLLHEAARHGACAALLGRRECVADAPGPGGVRAARRRRTH